ncbi:MAG TPA: DNA-directed RNA polymerase subunit omega [bacterium]|mgnify:CR=1 FL=1|nr:DNA-directed RNA polymerase subunit omega [bacterium]
MSEILLDRILQHSNNIYESVVAIFKRARQITNEQKQEIENEIGVSAPVDNRESEDFDEVEIDREALMREYKKYPKPSQVAIIEMAKGDLEFRYKDTDSQENSDSTEGERPS